MATYIIRRLFHAVIVMLIVSVIVFALIRVLPGDPIEMLLSEDMSAYSPERIEALKHEWGVDRPLVVQYLDWIFKAVQGDLGQSILYHYDIKDEIFNRLPISMNLAIIAFIIGITIGPLLGVLSAIRRGKWLDTLVTVVANVGITAPKFWVGILMIYFFGLSLGILPVYGYVSPFKDFSQHISHIIMPVFVMTLFPVASAARQTRSSVIEVMRQDYIRTAWSKGLSERVIIVRHALKNALMPVVTLQGMTLRTLLGGAVVTETVFFIPGMGSLTVNSMLAHDYPVIQGTILITSLLVVLINLIVDLLYGWLDPRIQYE